MFQILISYLCCYHVLFWSYKLSVFVADLKSSASSSDRDVISERPYLGHTSLLSSVNSIKTEPTSGYAESTGNSDAYYASFNPSHHHHHHHQLGFGFPPPGSANDHYHHHHHHHVMGGHVGAATKLMASSWNASDGGKQRWITKTVPWRLISKKQLFLQI